jgi:hypothetical protein
MPYANELYSNLSTISHGKLCSIDKGPNMNESN